MGSLRSDGVNDVVSLPAGSTSNAGNSTYTWWIKGTLRAAPTGLAGILGTSSATTSNGFATNATLQLRVYTTGTNRYGTGDNFFEVGVYHHYRLEHDSGGAWRAYRDDLVTPVASGTYGTSTVFVSLNQMFRSSSSSSMWSSWDMEEMGITSGSFSETYQADLSGGTGSTLPTVSGNNNGTLVNFPTNDTQWIGFGGAGAVLESNLLNVGTCTSALSTSIQLQSSTLNVSTISSSLSTSVRLQASFVCGSTITSDLTEVSSGLSGTAYSVSTIQAALSTGINLSSLLTSVSVLSSTLYEPLPETPDTLQNKKLILLHDAGEAYPLNTINDAMDTYLEVRYSVDQGLSDMISRYLGE
jgi:hypothetical protein